MSIEPRAPSQAAEEQQLAADNDGTTAELAEASSAVPVARPKISRDGSTITLTGSLDVYDAALLRQELLVGGAASEHLVVDLAEVERLGTAPLQVLLSLREPSTEFRNCSAQLRARLQRIGACELLLRERA